MRCRDIFASFNTYFFSQSQPGDRWMHFVNEISQKSRLRNEEITCMSGFEAANSYGSSNHSQSWIQCCHPRLYQWRFSFDKHISLILRAWLSVQQNMEPSAGSKETRNTLHWGPYSVIWECLCVHDKTAQHSILYTRYLSNWQSLLQITKTGLLLRVKDTLFS